MPLAMRGSSNMLYQTGHLRPGSAGFGKNCCCMRAAVVGAVGGITSIAFCIAFVLALAAAGLSDDVLGCFPAVAIG